jgi:hypothetical protein
MCCLRKLNNFIHYEHDETGIDRDRSRMSVLVLTSDKQVIHDTGKSQTPGKMQ